MTDNQQTREILRRLYDIAYSPLTKEHVKNSIVAELSKLEPFEENATFYSFKPSGKWKYTGRGHISQGVFRVYNNKVQRSAILADNGGKFPGMSTDGLDLTWVIIPDESCDYGFPLMLHGEES